MSAASPILKLLAGHPTRAHFDRTRLHDVYNALVDVVLQGKGFNLAPPAASLHFPDASGIYPPKSYIYHAGNATSSARSTRQHANSTAVNSNDGAEKHDSTTVSCANCGHDASPSVTVIVRAISFGAALRVTAVAEVECSGCSGRATGVGSADAPAVAAAPTRSRTISASLALQGDNQLLSHLVSSSGDTSSYFTDERMLVLVDRIENGLVRPLVEGIRAALLAVAPHASAAAAATTAASPAAAGAPASTALAPSLLRLPDPALQRILAAVGPGDACCFEAVCRDTRRVVDDEGLWGFFLDAAQAFNIEWMNNHDYCTTGYVRRKLYARIASAASPSSSSAVVTARSSSSSASASSLYDQPPVSSSSSSSSSSLEAVPPPGLMPYYNLRTFAVRYRGDYATAGWNETIPRGFLPFPKWLVDEARATESASEVERRDGGARHLCSSRRVYQVASSQLRSALRKQWLLLDQEAASMPGTGRSIPFMRWPFEFVHPAVPDGGGLRLPPGLGRGPAGVDRVPSPLTGPDGFLSVPPSSLVPPEARGGGGGLAIGGLGLGSGSGQPMRIGNGMPWPGGGGGGGSGMGFGGGGWH